MQISGSAVAARRANSLTKTRPAHTETGSAEAAAAGSSAFFFFSPPPSLPPSTVGPELLVLSIHPAKAGLTV